TSRSGSATNWSTTSNGAPSLPMNKHWTRTCGCSSMITAGSTHHGLAAHGPHRRVGRAVAFEELVVGRHGLDHLVDRRAHAIHKPLHVGVAERAGDQVVLLRHHALAEHAVGPRIQAEQLVLALPGIAALAEDADALGQLLRHLHLAARLPHRLVALVEVVVQDDEVADVLQLGAAD